MLKPKAYDAFKNMAIDEAILQSRICEKTPNTLRLYRWHPSAVSIGRFQNIYSEVNLENCSSHGVDVVRRISGGGAVYHDEENELTYSIVAKKEDLGINDVAEIFNYICRGIVETAHILGVDADFTKGNYKQCPNITIGGRKLSGSSQANRKGVVLQHGTFLVDVDLRKMFTFLKVPWIKASVDLEKIAERKITSIVGELGRQVSVAKVCKAVVEGFEKVLSRDLVEGNLTEDELKLARKLKREKFSTKEWNVNGKSNLTL
ncbi:MAG: lipoate--protein ligase family protein [Candidatus Bathyarchaeota archaeon]|nr:MAG: lipoate--protein ligase family protein [Candidatus Bathyarchaeota archaeon]